MTFLVASWCIRGLGGTTAAPSEALPGAFITKVDYSFGMRRIEYHCAECGAHHGHVFDDGPSATGKRFCNNGLCLIFKPEN